MANLTYQKITQLLEQYQPVFFFDPTEQFFPSVAEEVLAHEATESWDNVPTHQQIAKLAEDSRQTLHGLCEQPGGQPQYRDALPLQCLRKAARIQHHRLGNDRQPGSIQQRPPDLEGRGIEGWIAAMAKTVARRDLCVAIVDHQTVHRMMRDHHPLGLPG